MRVCHVTAERSAETFIKVFMKVKRNWLSKPKMYYTFKVTTKLQRTWFDLNGNVIKPNLSEKLTKAYGKYRDNKGKIKYLN